MVKSKKKKMNRGVLIFLILFTIFPFILGAMLIIYNHVYMSKAESTEAVVTFIQERRDVMRLFTQKIPHIRISIKYTVDGVDYHDVWSDKIKNAATVKVGDTFPVYYQPGKPEKATTGHDMVSAGIVCIVWGVIQPVFIFAVGFLSARKKREKREKNE